MYSFPSYIQDVYSEVHSWLDSQNDAKGFRTAKCDLDSDTIQGVATQFHQFFPTHYFKTLAALNELVSHDVVDSWIRDNDKLCVIDVGCGGGAASVAFIETVIQILESRISRQAHIHIIGVDPVKSALEINRAVLSRIINHKLFPRNLLRVTHECFCAPILDAASEVNSRVKLKREDWERPSLPHTLLLQVNVVRPLADQVQDIANAYHQIFMSTPMDYLHVLTIADKGKGAIRKAELDKLQGAIIDRFQDSQITPCVNHEMKYEYKNPADSFARVTAKKPTLEYSTTFRVAFNECMSSEQIGPERDRNKRDFNDGFSLKQL